ncbi:MAG: imidazole glycerol phosphate synthase cyclase subunit [Candidatus Thioglobus sp.]
MSTRIIAKLDVKPPYVVKPVHFEGLRKIGQPNEIAVKYYHQGADEIFYIDIVASLYQREILLDQVEQACSDVFVPFAVGGGVKTLNDFSALFHHGADKVVINTHALQNNPNIIDEAAKCFGSQAVVVNIESKRWDNWCECYSDCGRIRSGKRVLDWAKEVESRGAGEILLQSVDHDGRQRGFDIELAQNVVSLIDIPVVIASGAGRPQDVLELIKVAQPSGVALASLLHYGKSTVKDLKEYLIVNGVEVAV